MEILTTQYKQLANIPRPYTYKLIDLPWIEIIKTLKRKPRSVTHSRFVMMMPVIIQKFLQIEDMDKRQQRLSLLSELLKLYILNEIAIALERETNWQHERLNDRITHRLYALQHPEESEMTMLEISNPVITRDYQPNLTAYDRLLNGGVQHESNTY